MFDAAAVASAWLGVVETGRVQGIRLAPGFEYSSPLGVIDRSGARGGLRFVRHIEVRQVRSLDTIAGQDAVAVFYALQTAATIVRACDHIVVRGGLVRRIDSFYPQGAFRDHPRSQTSAPERRGAIW